MSVLLSEPMGFCIFCGEQLLEGEKALHRCYVLSDVKRTMSDAEGRPDCPWCGSDNVASILYGAPSLAMWQYMVDEKAVWGGCLVDGREPRWCCLDCSRRWGRPLREEPLYCSFCGRLSRGSWCLSC